MLRLDDHEARLRDLAAQLESRLMNRREVARLCVRGPAGAGRRTILSQLARNPGVVAIEPPALTELDAALCALVQAASPLPGYHELVADRRAETGDIDQDMSRRAEAVGKALAAAGKAVALLVPHSWSEPGDDADALACVGRARALVAGLEAAGKLPILLVGFPPPGSKAHAYSMVELPPIRLEAAEIDPGALPGALRAAGERLVQHLRATRAEVAPVELRLRLGLVALGRDPASLDDLRLVALARQLAARLSRAQAAGLARLLLARRALAPAVAEQLAGLGGDDLALLTTCVAYGGDRLQVAEPARAALLEQLRALDLSPPRAELEEGHRILADHYQSIELASEPASEPASRIDGLAPAQAAAWLEKLHHLAHGGAATAERWRAHRLFARELVWARARALSEAGDHAQAASLFCGSLGPFGDHPYAHHQYAQNLEAAKDDPELIDHHYRDAVTFDPENPFSNARLVTFQISRGAYEKARREWRDATERVDPAGRRMNEGGWVALHLHQPVARAWLAAGRAAEARAVLDDVPPRHLLRELPLAQLARELEDAEARPGPMPVR